MLRWMKARFQKFVDWAAHKEIERLLKKNQRLKAESIAANGGKPIRLSAQDRAKLDALRKKLDPELVKKYDLRADHE